MADDPAVRPLPPPDLPPGIRHDLINALNAVLGYATLLQMDVPEGEARRWVDRLMEAARQAQALAERIPASSARTIPAGAEPRPVGRRVLLVAQGPVGDLLERLLDQRDCNPVRVQHWAEAAELLSAGAPDVDIALAEGPGPDTCLPVVTFRPLEPPADILRRLDQSLDALKAAGGAGNGMRRG